MGKPAPLTLRTPAALDAATGSAGTGILVRRGETCDRTLLGQAAKLTGARRFEFGWLARTAVLALLSLLIFHALLLRLKTKIWLRFRAVLSLVTTAALALLISRLVLSLSNWSPLACPLAFPAMLLATVAPSGLAFGVNLLVVVLAGVLLPLDTGPILAPLAAGWTAVMLLGRQSGLMRLLAAALGGALAGALFWVFLAWPGSPGDFLSLSSEGHLVGMGTGMLGSGLLAWLLGSPLVRLSGGVSRTTVRNLLELDRPLLKELSEKAPGTFAHSMAMANMAEKVAQDLGADADLVRAGAYYHDVGKMRHPELFIENQEAVNPHEHLRPEESAVKLRAHISDGVALARAANVPSRVIDFIVEHHGTSIMDFFFDLAARQGSAPPHPGPVPLRRPQPDQPRDCHPDDSRLGRGGLAHAQRAHLGRGGVDGAAHPFRQAAGRAAGRLGAGHRGPEKHSLQPHPHRARPVPPADTVSLAAPGRGLGHLPRPATGHRSPPAGGPTGGRGTGNPAARRRHQAGAYPAQGWK